MSTWLVLLVLIILAETDTAQCLCLNPSSLRVLRRSIRGGTFENAGNRILRMSSQGNGGAQGNGGGGGGLTKLDRKTAQKTITKPTYKEEIEKDWRLVLHDDTVHTIQQVCDIVAKSCPLCPGPRAYEVTLEVHMTGAGTVAVANKKTISEYAKSLQAAGLTVSMSPDEEFDGGDIDGD
eukprot:CAMPEP_0170389104 /NCGR_PEP_ID=MMETSP0117_2-20130122/18439_1 /TAXON_ID=400756 /ORGANISM="Durinskia baltica, Strain CSIRO CS-38" /LENGTH=178 /DNA_ID=CAMNT_0010645069 /DNA_START=64 /DNA_END=600 /DNA_ORIENTATION=+